MWVAHSTRCNVACLAWPLARIANRKQEAKVVQKTVKTDKNGCLQARTEELANLCHDGCSSSVVWHASSVAGLVVH
eukprot:6482925-Amphidinium_carterae.1